MTFVFTTHYAKAKSLLAEYSLLNIQQLRSRGISLSLVENSIVTRAYLKRYCSKNIKDDTFDTVIETLIDSEMISKLSIRDFESLTNRLPSVGSVYYLITQYKTPEESKVVDDLSISQSKTLKSYSQGWNDAKRASLEMIEKRLNAVLEIKSSGNSYERVKKVLGHLINDVNHLEVPLGSSV